MSSSRRIDYRVRPAKVIERKMLCELFQCLREVVPIHTYTYVGLGSYYFSDFRLFHKALGITDMVAIERDTSNRERYWFNRPFRCIDLRFGHTNQLLAQLDWSKPMIMWLDYEDPLNTNILGDVKQAITHMKPGSILAVTCNAMEPEEGLEKLKEFGNLAPHVTMRDLTGWKTAALYWKIIRREIDQTLVDRNAGSSEREACAYEQLLHLRYRDGARMLTVGGILLEKNSPLLDRVRDLTRLFFVRNGEEPYSIEPPNLTYREIQHLEAQLPCVDPASLKHCRIPESDLTRYAECYRYLPVFAESEL